MLRQNIVDAFKLNPVDMHGLGFLANFLPLWQSSGAEGIVTPDPPLAKYIRKCELESSKITSNACPLHDAN